MRELNTKILLCIITNGKTLIYACGYSIVTKFLNFFRSKKKTGGIERMSVNWKFSS